MNVKLNKLKMIDYKIMIKVTSPYGVNNLVGSRKDLLAQLRYIAKEKRRSSRLNKGFEDSVHSIDRGLHQAELVTMSSWKIDELDVDPLISLLNDHGIKKFQKINLDENNKEVSHA